MSGFDIPSIVIGAIISAIIAVVVTKYYSTKKKLCFLSTANVALDPEPDSLPSQVKILFGERQISNIHRVDFAVWNGGNRELRASDFLEQPGIAIEISGCEILELAAIERSRDSMNAAIELNAPNSIAISVENLNQGEFIIATILVEKEAKSKIECSAKATISGVPDGITRIVDPGITSWNDVSAYAAMTAFFGFFAYICASLAYAGVFEEPFRAASAIAEWIDGGEKTAAGFSIVLASLIALVGVGFALFGFVGLYFLAFYRTSLPLGIRRHFGISNQFSKLRKVAKSASEELIP